MIRIKGIGVDENNELSTACLGNRPEVITQNSAIDKALEKVDEKLFKVMTILQRNTDNIEQLNNDLTNLKKDEQGKFDDMKQIIDDMKALRKNVDELKEKKVPDEDMTSLAQELKNCIKSNQSIEKDYSAIKEKLYKVYGKNFLNR